jgi:RNA 2',3'-cyclic 3'-phosphodiesterase
VRAFLGVDVGAFEGAPPDASPLHVTLRFLGEVDADGIERVVTAMPAAVAPVAPFDLGLGGVGAFPSAAGPRVVWLSVREGGDELRRLAAGVTEALARVGWPPEPGTFVPHVTLFRVRSPHDRRRALDLLEGRTAPPTARVIRVRSVALKESRLGPHGAQHHVVREFALGGGERP